MVERLFQGMRRRQLESEISKSGSYYSSSIGEEQRSSMDYLESIEVWGIEGIFDIHYEES